MFQKSLQSGLDRHYIEQIMIRGIHHISIHVRDFSRMLKFYREAFGFEIVDEEFNWRESAMIDRIMDISGSAGRGAMLRAGTCYIEMFQFEAPDPSSSHPLRPFDKRYTHFCVDVTDIEQEVERLRTVGMSFGDRSPVDVGHVKTLYGRDPEGNVIEIQQTRSHCGFRLDALPPVRT